MVLLIFFSFNSTKNHDKCRNWNSFSFEPVATLVTEIFKPLGKGVRIFCRGVPPSFLNPDPTLDRTMPFSIPVFRHDL